MWVTDDNGNVMYGSIKPETKTALENIAKLVADGIIDRDFAVKDSDQFNELVTSGKGGIFFGSWWNLQWPLSDMWKTDDSVKWNIYAVPLDDNGIYNVHMMNPSTTYLVVRKDYQNLEAVIKTLNMQRRVAVSYTHLDVYKRQALHPVIQPIPMKCWIMSASCPTAPAGLPGCRAIS